jgi:hypothetical protein
MTTLAGLLLVRGGTCHSSSVAVIGDLMQVKNRHWTEHDSLRKRCNTQELSIQQSQPFSSWPTEIAARRPRTVGHRSTASVSESMLHQMPCTVSPASLEAVNAPWPRPLRSNKQMHCALPTAWLQKMCRPFGCHAAVGRRLRASSAAASPQQSSLQPSLLHTRRLAVGLQQA